MFSYISLVSSSYFIKYLRTFSYQKATTKQGTAHYFGYRVRTSCIYGRQNLEWRPAVCWSNLFLKIMFFKKKMIKYDAFFFVGQGTAAHSVPIELLEQWFLPAAKPSGHRTVRVVVVAVVGWGLLWGHDLKGRPKVKVNQLFWFTSSPYLPS